MEKLEELDKENKRLKEFVIKIKSIFKTGWFKDDCDCILIEKLIEDLKEEYINE